MQFKKIVIFNLEVRKHSVSRYMYVHVVFKKKCFLLCLTHINKLFMVFAIFKEEELKLRNEQV